MQASSPPFPSGVDHHGCTRHVFDHNGIKPHRIRDNSRRGSFGFWRMTGTGWVGAMLYRGFQSGSSEMRIEVLLNDLLSPRQSIASAHGEIISSGERDAGEPSRKGILRPLYRREPKVSKREWAKRRVGKAVAQVDEFRHVAAGDSLMRKYLQEEGPVTSPCRERTEGRRRHD